MVGEWRRRGSFSDITEKDVKRKERELNTSQKSDFHIPV
jgi:hypothetical protein